MNEGIQEKVRTNVSRNTSSGMKVQSDMFVFMVLFENSIYRLFKFYINE